MSLMQGLWAVMILQNNHYLLTVGCYDAEYWGCADHAGSNDEYAQRGECNCASSCYDKPRGCCFDIEKNLCFNGMSGDY